MRKKKNLHAQPIPTYEKLLGAWLPGANRDRRVRPTRHSAALKAAHERALSLEIRLHAVLPHLDELAGSGNKMAAADAKKCRALLHKRWAR